MLRKVHFAKHLRNICETKVNFFAFFALPSLPFPTAKLQPFLKLTKYFLRKRVLVDIENQWKYVCINALKEIKKEDF